MSELGFTWTDEGEFGVYIRNAALSGGLGRRASDFEARVLRRIDLLEERNAALHRRRDSILAPLRARVRELKAAVDAVNRLIDNSSGVAGLHLNGDVAPWEDLLEGGQYEEWLLPLAAVDAEEADSA